MITTILTGVLTSGLLLSSFSPTAPAAPMPQSPRVVFTQVIPEDNFVSYSTHKGDTLETIAQDRYGDKSYWKTLWNNNSWIEDPNDLQSDLRIHVQVEKPAEPDTEVTKLVEGEQENPVEAVPTPVSLAEKQLPTPIAVVNPSVVPVQSTNTPPTATVAVSPSRGPVITSQTTSSISEEAITYLGNCEAGMNPAKNTGNGYYGAFQFSAGTWRSMNTGYERADLAPIEVQKAAVRQLIQRSSIYTQFPACASRMRNAGLI